MGGSRHRRVYCLESGETQPLAALPHPFYNLNNCTHNILVAAVGSVTKDLKIPRIELKTLFSTLELGGMVGTAGQGST